MDKSSTLSNQRLRVVVANGLIMALYVAVTVLVAPVASGAIQFRVSEGLNHLVVFNRKLMWGVFGGVVLYNLFLVWEFWTSSLVEAKPCLHCQQRRYCKRKFRMSLSV